MSGYWVELWLPQIVTLAISVLSAAGLFGKLADRTVVVETNHRGEAARIEIRCVLLRDQGIRVGRIADHEHAHIPLGMGVERLALRPEDRTVGFEQILALHAGAARTRADQQGVVDILEGDIGVIGGDHTVQGRERAIIQLHDHAIQRRQAPA